MDDERTPEHDQISVFVIGPDDPLHGDVFAVIEGAFPKFDVVDWRKIEHGGSATARLVRRLFESDFVVADLRGQKPNVLYELGLAHAFGTPVLCISDTTQDLPFNIADSQVIGIAFGEGGVKQRADVVRNLQSAANAALREAPLTPVSAAGISFPRQPSELLGLADARAIWATLAREQLLPSLQPVDVELDIDVFHAKHGVGRITAFSRPSAGPLKVTVVYVSGRRETSDVPSRRLYVAELDAIRRS